MRRLTALLTATALVALLGGCSAATPQASLDATPTAQPPFGATALVPPAAKYVIATVGDSHATRFAQGMSEVGGDAYQVVNGAFGGCGIMRESRYKLTTSGIDKAEVANHACDDWDVKWRRLVEQSKPNAVLLTTSFWDANAKEIDGSGTFRQVSDTKFRDRYMSALEQGIDILSSQGARVYLDNSLPYLGNDMPSAEAMSKTVTQVYREAKAAGKNVGLLDIRGQVCSGSICPSVIDGIAVLDQTGHPSGESLARQSRWILNTISTDLAKTSR